LKAAPLGAAFFMGEAMGKIILLAALVLSGCGYYTAPRDKRFIAALYIGMPVAELEVLAKVYRGIRLL